MNLKIESENEKAFGPCDCCGNMSRRVWGYVEGHHGTIAAYFVEWTVGHEDHAANFDLIIGRWGDTTIPADRFAVALAYRNILPKGPEFMVIDAADRAFSRSPLIGTVLSRKETLESPLRTEVFEICDAIYLQDRRIAEITA